MAEDGWQMQDAGCVDNWMANSGFRIQDGWMAWLHLARAASGLSERTEIWEMHKEYKR